MLLQKLMTDLHQYVNFHLSLGIFFWNARDSLHLWDVSFSASLLEAAVAGKMHALSLLLQHSALALHASQC